MNFVYLFYAATVLKRIPQWNRLSNIIMAVLVLIGVLNLALYGHLSTRSKYIRIRLRRHRNREGLKCVSGIRGWSIWNLMTVEHSLRLHCGQFLNEAGTKFGANPLIPCSLKFLRMIL